jgi:hypothetical protein
MKSAYEIAMERLEKKSPSGPPLTDAQRNELAEVDTLYESKIAEVKIACEQDLKQAAGNPGIVDQVRYKYREDLARLEAEREEKKADIRKRATT